MHMVSFVTYYMILAYSSSIMEARDGMIENQPNHASIKNNYFCYNFSAEKYQSYFSSYYAKTPKAVEEALIISPLSRSAEMISADANFDFTLATSIFAQAEITTTQSDAINTLSAESVAQAGVTVDHAGTMLACAVTASATASVTSATASVMPACASFMPACASTAPALQRSSLHKQEPHPLVHPIRPLVYLHKLLMPFSRLHEHYLTSSHVSPYLTLESCISSKHQNIQFISKQ